MNLETNVELRTVPNGRIFWSRGAMMTPYSRLFYNLTKKLISTKAKGVMAISIPKHLT